MSDNRSRPKLIKRHISDDSDGPHKRQKIALISPQNHLNVKEKCSATRRQNILRDRDKKSRENISSQSRVKLVKTLTAQEHVEKSPDVKERKPMIVRRSKKHPGKFVLKDETGEETIIEIDNSSQPTDERRSDNTLKRTLVTHKRKELRGEERQSGESFRSCRSLVTVSEVTDSEKSFNSKNPLQQRLNRFRKTVSDSSTKTITPNSDKKIQNIQSKETLRGSPPKGLKIPLKRNLVKRTFDEFKSSSSSSINSKDEYESNSGDSRVLKGPEESESILKRIAFVSTNVLATKRQKFNRNSEAPSFHNQIIDRKESKAPEKPAILKFAESLASKRLSKLRDSLKNTETKREAKHVSPLKRTLEVESTERKREAKHVSPLKRTFEVKSTETKRDAKHVSPLKRTSEVENTDIAKNQKRHEKQHHNFIPNLFRNNNNKPESNARSPVDQIPEPKFNIILPTSSASNRLKLIKEKQRRSLEVGLEAPKQVFGRHSGDNAESSTASGQDTKNVFMQRIQRKSNESQNQNEGLKVFNKEPSTSAIRTTFQEKASTLQNRLLRFSNKESIPENRVLLKKHSSTMDIDSSQDKQLSQELMNVDRNSQQESEFPSTSTSKSVYIENWMTDVNPPARLSEAYQNDSLLVNVDDTLLNKSELMTELQDDTSMEWDAMSESTEVRPTPESEPIISIMTKEPFICIVTDTNVFLHDLPKIRELLALSTSGKHKLKIFIPWMVQQEIDNFKDSFSLNLKPMALAAQKLINSQLMQPDSKVIGQSITDVCDQVDLGKAPDDKILACLLQAGKKYESVILLSNDIGLRNKAFSNNFKAYSPKEILAIIRNSKCLRIKIRLQNFLSQVIFHCCKEAFGDLCTKMEVLQGCPWAFEECLKRFKRHWSSAFQQSLLKHCYKCVDELLGLCSQGDILDSDQIKLTKFKDKVKEFLFYIQDVQHFNSTAKKMRAEVDSIFSSDSAT